MSCKETVWNTNDLEITYASDCKHSHSALPWSCLAWCLQPVAVGCRLVLILTKMIKKLYASIIFIAIKSILKIHADWKIAGLFPVTTVLGKKISLFFYLFKILGKMTSATPAPPTAVLACACMMMMWMTTVALSQCIRMCIYIGYNGIPESGEWGKKSYTKKRIPISRLGIVRTIILNAQN